MNRYYNEIVIPPPDLTPCGRLTATPEQFYNSACEEADRLVADMNLSGSSAILDIGCGVGRLPVGLLAKHLHFSSYLGIDVDAQRIAWCQENLTPQDRRLAFQFINMRNERYNPAGDAQIDIGLAGRRFDIIYLYSVFSHLLQRDAEAYLAQFRLALNDSGLCFLTMFVADGVPDCTENPADFGPLRWAGRLHCVRYARNTWHSMVEQAGLKILSVVENVNVDGQTGYYLSRAG